MHSTTAQPNAATTAKIINPILSSVIETFEVMMSCKVERGPVELRQPGDTLHDISALIGISGRVKGAVCVSFAARTAVRVVDRFLGESSDLSGSDYPSDITPDVVDALGEVVNMVGGSAKSKLNMGLNIGLPNVVHGQDHVIEFPANAKPMRLYFESDIGPFFVDFGFVVREVD